MKNYYAERKILLEQPEKKMPKQEPCEVKKATYWKMVCDIRRYAMSHKGRIARESLEAGLKFAYDMTGEWSEDMIQHSLVMYYKGVILASEPNSITQRIARRILEVLDIEPIFNAVYGTQPLGGLASAHYGITKRDIPFARENGLLERYNEETMKKLGLQ